MLLTVDIGTTNFKAAIWDFNLKRLAFSAEKLPEKAICENWLSSFENCCRKLFKNINPAEIEAIVISGNGPTLVPVLEEPYVKNRKLFAPAEIPKLWLYKSAIKYSEKASELMGCPVDGSFFLPKILEIKSEESSLYQKVKCFLGCPEYLGFALTGQARTVIPSQGYENIFWNDCVLEKLSLDSAKFPRLISPGESFGSILPQVSDLFGIKKSIPVISGGPDYFCAILGAGVTKPGQALDRTGSSEGINLCAKKRVFSDSLFSYGHPVKPYWNLSGFIRESGLAIERESKLLGLKDTKDFFLLAERNPGTEKGKRANCVLLDLCFKVKEILSLMENSMSSSGEEINQLRVTGGLASNGFYNQIKADVTGKEILVPEYIEAELTGGAIIGSCFLGKYGSFKDASLKAVKIKMSYKPK